MEYLLSILCALLGTLLASLLACVPALHIYNVAGLMLLLLARSGADVSSHYLMMFMLGMVVGYAYMGIIPSLFFSAPDESTVWIVAPSQRYLMQQRVHEAALLAGVGCAGGMIVLAVLAPFMILVLSSIHQLVQQHLHWLLGLFTVYLLLSEWPRGAGRGRHVLSRLWDGWKSLLAGLITFLLSGALGFLLVYRPIVPPNLAFQGLMPAFVGLYAISWIVQNILSRTEIPHQYVCTFVDNVPGTVAWGVGTGVLGGFLAAFFPGLTGSIGGLVAGQATAQRDDRAFIVSQGASRAVYLVGTLLFFVAPGLNLTRGGMAWLLASYYVPKTPMAYWLAVASMATCGALAFALFLWLSRGAIVLLNYIPYRHVLLAASALLVAMVVIVTGWKGLLVMITATGIGLIPTMFSSRRMNCTGVLLVPLLLSMAGKGAMLARWFGLL